MEDTSEGQVENTAAEAAAKDEAWRAGSEKGRELALQGETRSESVKEAGREAGRAAAEKTGADAGVGERPGEHGALAGWIAEDPGLIRQEEQTDSRTKQDQLDAQKEQREADKAALSSDIRANEQSLRDFVGSDWTKDE